MSFDFLYNFFPETFLILGRIQRDIVITVKTCSCKVPLFLFDFNETFLRVGTAHIGCRPQFLGFKISKSHIITHTFGRTPLNE